MKTTGESVSEGERPRDTPERAASPGPTRREFLAGGAAALAGTAAALARPGVLRAARPRATGAQLPSRPNLLILITDQERYPRHWPEGWADQNLPHRKQLADTGITFTNAFCNAAMCSPSRSTLVTGLYPAQHGVVHTLTTGGSFSPFEPVLPVDLQNLGKMLATAGYNVVWKGKWHMSKPVNGETWTSEDVAAVAAYGFNQWDPPDAGEDTDPDHFGGGCAQNDRRFVDDAVAFLQTQTAESTATTPFALVVSLVNPHDVLAYPRTWDEDGGEGCNNYADSAGFDLGITLPESYSADDLSTKPTAQRQTLTYLNAGLGVLPTALDRRRYVNFYAYLHKVVDEQIGRITQAVEDQGLRESTIIIRTSDHGELGLAHGGLRQKMFNAYEETINIPLVFSNPILFPSPVVTDSLASLVDIAPTIATLAQVPSRHRWTFRGFDLSPILADPTVAVQDAVLFTFDDENAGAGFEQTTVTQPNHIRCIREKNWKYVRYFDPEGNEPEQYELYDLAADPNEIVNLAGDPAYQETRNELARKLAELEARRLAPLYRAYLPSVRR